MIILIVQYSINSSSIYHIIVHCSKVVPGIHVPQCRPWSLQDSKIFRLVCSAKSAPTSTMCQQWCPSFWCIKSTHLQHCRHISNYDDSGLMLLFTATTVSRWARTQLWSTFGCTKRTNEITFNDSAWRARNMLSRVGKRTVLFTDFLWPKPWSSCIVAVFVWRCLFLFPESRIYSFAVT